MASVSEAGDADRGRKRTVVIRANRATRVATQLMQ